MEMHVLFPATLAPPLLMPTASFLFSALSCPSHPTRAASMSYNNIGLATARGT